MPLVEADIRFHLATLAGTAGFQQASTGSGSLGKYISTTELSKAGVLHALFDLVTGDENATPEAEFRAFFVRNAHATLTLFNAVLWVASEIAGGASMAISIDATPTSPVGQSAAQAKQVANEDTAPASQSFSAPTTKAAALALGDIPAGSCRAVWVRRTTVNSTALDPDGGTLRLAGDQSG